MADLTLFRKQVGETSVEQSSRHGFHAGVYAEGIWSVAAKDDSPPIWAVFLLKIRGIRAVRKKSQNMYSYKHLALVFGT